MFVNINLTGYCFVQNLLGDLQLGVVFPDWRRVGVPPDGENGELLRNFDAGLMSTGR